MSTNPFVWAGIYGASAPNKYSTTVAFRGTGTLAASGVAAITGGGSWAGGAIAARPSDSLLDFWGVDAHFTYTTYTSKGLDTIAALIQAAGLRWVRDGIEGGATPMANVGTIFANHNLKLWAVHSPASDLSLSRVQTFHDLYAQYFGSNLLGVEGWNEPGGFTGYTTGSTLANQVLQWQQWIWQVYRTNSTVYGATPIAGPSLADANSATKWGALNLTSWADMANMHDYPGNSYAMVDSDFTRFINNGNLMVNKNRRITTETGTSSGQSLASYPVPSPEGAGITIPRVQWEHFRRGWDWSSTYEFMNQGTDGTFEHTFGLVDNNLVAKPAYTVVKNTFTLLADPGSAFGTTALNATISGSTTTRYSLLQKRDGSYWVALWEQQQVWNSSTGSLSPTVHVPVTFAFDRSRTVSIYQPGTSASPISSASGTTVTVDNTQTVQLIKIV